MTTWPDNTPKSANNAFDWRASKTTVALPSASYTNGVMRVAIGQVKAAPKFRITEPAATAGALKEHGFMPAGGFLTWRQKREKKVRELLIAGFTFKAIYAVTGAGDTYVRRIRREMQAEEAT